MDLYGGFLIDGMKEVKSVIFFMKVVRTKPGKWKMKSAVCTQCDAACFNVSSERPVYGVPCAGERSSALFTLTGVTVYTFVTISIPMLLLWSSLYSQQRVGKTVSKTSMNEKRKVQGFAGSWR